MDLLIPISTYLKKKLCYLVTFSFLWDQTTHVRTGRHENKENHLFYFDLRFLLPIWIQLLDIENPKNPKNPKIHPPTL
jgi:hypothetical protein